jgi:hypothetical protein
VDSMLVADAMSLDSSPSNDIFVAVVEVKTDSLYSV